MSMDHTIKDQSEDYWKGKLTPQQYHVLREKGTETPGSGELLYNDKDGIYKCSACGAPLFKSDTKYESTVPGLIGWPSFSDATSNEAIVLSDDSSDYMHRTEVTCASCGGHLGHLFPDESSPNGKHYCINSICLEFEPKD